MSIVYQLIPLLAAFAEGLIVISVPGKMCGRKYKNSKNILLTLGFSAVYAVLVTAMNSLVPYPYAVTVPAMIYSFAVPFVLSKRNIALNFASVMMTWFFYYVLDYVISFGIIFAVGIEYSFVMLLVPKLIEIFVFFAFSKIYPKVRLLGKKNLYVLFSVSLIAFTLLSVISGLIFSDSVFVMQMSLMLSAVFVVLSFIATITAVSINTKYEKEKRESSIMAATNAMMEKNFSELQNAQNTMYQQIHDFKNHIRTIGGMIEKDDAAKAYVEELLSANYNNVRHCNCGNKVIDSIINCKIAGAEAAGINFDYRVRLSSDLYLSAVDLCAILANQIDNAIEACENLPGESNKTVSVEIWQKEFFVFFKVINPCRENPFNASRQLKSTKKGSEGLHGYGIKNIAKTVERYGGTLKNDYKNGIFTSVVMVPNNNSVQE